MQALKAGPCAMRVAQQLGECPRSTFATAKPLQASHLWLSSGRAAHSALWKPPSAAVQRSAAAAIAGGTREGDLAGWAGQAEARGGGTVRGRAGSQPLLAGLPHAGFRRQTRSALSTAAPSAVAAVAAPTVSRDGEGEAAGWEGTLLQLRSCRCRPPYRPCETPAIHLFSDSSIRLSAMQR